VSLFYLCAKIFNLSMAFTTAMCGKTNWTVMFMGLAIMWQLDEMKSEGCQKGKG
jgi:hypothetical protein